MANKQKDKMDLRAGMSADFEAIRISVASPENIFSWSHGEVIKPETINYRTQKPERDGLFCEKIFGPTKDYECYCGKYKKIRYKGIICDRCGVEITRSSVRRERMGHIDLAVPVAHIWYLHGVPSVLSTILDISVNDLEKVIYFASFIILSVNEDVRKEALEQLENEYQELKRRPEVKKDPIIASKVDANYRLVKQEISGLDVKQILTEAKYHELSLKYGQIVEVGIGAEAIYQLLKQIDINQTISQLEAEIERHPVAHRRRYLRQLRVFWDLKNAGIRPQWLVLVRLPVIPPDLRPMVQLDGGRFATSDLNDLYRRVLNRNNRLKRLSKQGAPEVICRNEKRMLQEAVDALIDNSARRGKVATTSGSRKLRSLSDILRGKQGRFRQNLLGKRVDYSGRSVIVIGPDLKLHQCGVPKIMALELFKTFVIARLISEGYVHNVKNATRMIENQEPVIWDLLEKITSQYYVLLNRAPTLHRLGIQAFQPVLIEGKAIQIHPLVCYAFNADFDGDQMAVHVPLSKQAFNEAAKMMLASRNLLKPASGEPVVTPRLDMVLGCYYITSYEDGVGGTGKIYGSKNEAIMAYQQGDLHVRAKIKVRIKGEVVESDSEVKKLKSGNLVETTVGRILFNNILPDAIGFLNVPMHAKNIKTIVARVFKELGRESTAQVVDRLKEIGFEHAGLSGITISVDDIQIPHNKKELISQAEEQVEKIETQYRRGLITAEERQLKVIELWTEVRSEVEQSMIDDYDKNNPVWVTVSSGARGSTVQLVQMAGMKGLVVNPTGQIIELPIKSNFKEGLSVFEYFISTHGSRKGKSDTSLRTSDAGYLTRRLVDVAQDTVINAKDCGTKRFILLTREESEQMGEKFADRLSGRIAAESIKTDDRIICKKDEEITEEISNAIVEAGITVVKVRSVLTCELKRGACQLCYGRDLGTGEMVQLGTTVGIIAAQAIGEPGTQLTMKTFHLGGVTGEDITSGLPRVEELFEARPPRTGAIMAEIDGEISIVQIKGERYIRIISPQKASSEVKLLSDYKPTVKTSDIVVVRQVVAVAEGKKALRTPIAGKVKVEKDKIVITSSEPMIREYQLPPSAHLKISNSDKIIKGQQLTEGHLNLNDSLRLRGPEATQKYILKEVKDIYSSQGQSINDKHIELIVRQMFALEKILDEGDSELVPGQLVHLQEIVETNLDLKKKNKKPVISEPVVLGITRVALRTDSFLSAASFQETTNVLIDAAVRGAVDHLKGLKENVIIGRLIPAGTGFTKFKT